MILLLFNFTQNRPGPISLDDPTDCRASS